MEAGKRLGEEESALVPAKRSRQEIVPVEPTGKALISTVCVSLCRLLQGPPRTSSLMAPVMLLTGHEV